MKLLLIGYGRHGKDSAAEYLKEKYGMSFASSSYVAADKVMMPYFASIGKSYATVEECFNDRHTGDNRIAWYEQIKAYNGNGARLAREILAENDIYVGMRNWKEMMAARNEGFFDYAIWIDRTDHCPVESKFSMSIEPWMADYMIDNNGTLEDLHRNLDGLMQGVLARPLRIRRPIAQL